MAEEHHSRVIVEGDSTSYVSAAQKATKATEGMQSSAAKAAKTNEDLRESSEKAAKSTAGIGAAAKKASDPLVELSKNATRSGSSVVQLGQSVFNVAKAFGGWGVAVAIVGDLLLGLVESSNKATEAAEKQKKALREQNEAARDARDAETIASFKAREASTAETKAKWEDYAARVKIAETAEELSGIEEALAAHGRKKDTLALQKRETEIRAENLRLVGDTAGALELERKEELRIIGLLNEKEKAAKRANAAMKGNALGDAGAQRALGFAGFRGNVAGKSEGMRFDAEAGRVGAMQREGSDTRGANDAQYAADARLKAIEIERATTGETLSLINQEEEARRRLLQTQIDAAVYGGEKEQLKAELEQVQHEARLKRIDAERAAEEKKAARKVALMDLVDRVAAGSAATATMIARTAGASAKKQEQIAAGVAGGQAIIIGVLESVKAAAAFASFNPIQGAMHVAAAAFAYAQGGMLLAQAGGAGGSSSGASSAGGGGMPSGGTQSEPSGQTFRGGDSAIPGSPGPQSPTAVGSSAGPNRTTVIQINGDVYGTPRKEFIRSIREGLDLDRQGGRARRTGSDG